MIYDSFETSSENHKKRNTELRKQESKIMSFYMETKNVIAEIKFAVEVVKRS